MNKHIFGRKLSRSRPAREALFSSLARALILSGRISTSKAKAKAVQGEIEKMVTLARKGGVFARRTVLARLDNDKFACDLLFQKVTPLFSKRSSGFTRIVALGVRRGDNAPIVRIEWTETVDYSKQTTVKSGKEAKEKVEKEPAKKKQTKKAVVRSQ